MNSKFIQNLNFLILDHLDDSDFSVDFICKELNVSRSSLYRKIKLKTGLSTSLYVRKIKLIKAKELLLTTEMNVSEIAYATGIGSPQNFSRYFVKEFGLSPTAIRKIELEATLPEIPLQKESESNVSKLDLNINGRQKWLIFPFLILGIVITMTIALTNPQDDYSEKLDSYQLLKKENGIAILPFIENGDFTHPSLGEGIAEDIIVQLSKIKSIPVVSKSSSFQFSDTEDAFEIVAQELEVPFVLSGSISKDKGSFVVFTELLDTRNGENLWTKQFLKDTSKLQDIQSEIALEVATSLLKKAKPEIIYKVKKVSTENVEAYYQVTIGKELLQSRLKNDLEESIKRFDEAIRIDPSYSNAFAYRAMAIHLLGELRYREPQSSNDEAEVNALEALRLDNSNGYAYGILGNIYAQQYKWDQAESTFEIALESNPGDALLNYWFSLIKRTKNKISEALFYNEKAKLLDPLYPVIHAGYIATCIYGEKLDKAQESIKKDSILFRNSFLYYWVKGEYYMASSEYEKALTYFEKGLVLNPDISSLKTSRAYVKAKLGDFEMAHSIISSLDPEVPSEIHTKAVLLSALGKDEASLNHFIEAAEKGFMASDVLVDPRYALIVANPKYQTYLRKYNYIQ